MTDDAGAESARTKAESRRSFPYAAYFRDVNLAPQLLMAPEEIPWLTSIPADPEPRDTVLYLGCQALRTPEFCLEAIDVLGTLRADFVSFGGSAVCCGSVHQFFGHDIDLAERVSSSTTAKIARFKARNVLTICPNCNFQYEKGVASRSEPPFRMRHFYEYLHEHLAELRFVQPIAKKIGLHRHAGSSHHQDEHGQMCFDILSSIPGTEIVDLPQFPELGPICYGRAHRSLDDKRHGEIMDALFASALEQRCDVVATIYHACQRELCHEERRGPFTVRSVVGLVAEALGGGRGDRLKRLKKADDLEAALSEVEPNRAARGISHENTRAVIGGLLGRSP
jgi:Fe-S oxidoreductase